MTTSTSKHKTPAEVIKLWEKLCHKLKPRSPGSKRAKEYAAMCGMRSMGEVSCAANMDLLKIPYEYEKHTLQYQHAPQTYTPDFVLPNGMVIEFKGKMTAETRKKMISIKRSNPNVRIGIVFQKANNKLSSKPNSTRYWQWAETNGFLHSDAYVPKEWARGRRKTLR